MELKTARKIAGLTQQELAERAGVTDSFISLLESGKRDIRTTEHVTVVRLARALGVEPDEMWPIAPMAEGIGDDSKIGVTPCEVTTRSDTPALDLTSPAAAAFTFQGPWFTAKEARAYVCCKTMQAWYVWRNRHGIVPRSNGSVAKADLDRALKFRRKKRIAEATLNNLRHHRAPIGGHPSGGAGSHTEKAEGRDQTG